MSRSSWRRVERCFTVAVLFLCALPARAAVQELLAVRLNGIEQSQEVQVLREGDRLAMPLSAWERLGLKLPGAPASWHDGEPYQPLDAAALTWAVDGPTQTLSIDAPPRAFAGGAVQTKAPADVLIVPAGVGGHLNYDLRWQKSGSSGAATATGLTALNLFSPLGNLDTQWLWRHADPQGLVARRLGTTLSRDVPERMGTWRLGDTVTQGGAWGRPVRLTGLQWGTDFTLQPGFVSYPLPSVRGEAALPSSVDVFVNNGRRLQGQVAAGAFDLHELPVVNGQGELRLVVRDLLGREQVVTQPYYLNTSLLRPGLRASGWEIGALRRDVGYAEARYGRLAGAYTDRLGVNEHFTRELRVEAAAGQAAAGASGTWLFPALGTLQLGVVGSRADDAQGLQLSAGFERQARDWSGSLRWRVADAGFRQLGQGAVAAGQTARAPSSEFIAAFGTGWRQFGVGVSVLSQRRRDMDTPLQWLSLNLSRGFGTLGTLSVFALRDLQGGGTTVTLGFSMALAPTRGQVSYAATRQRSDAGRLRQDLVQWQRSPDADGTPGWRVSAEQGDVSRQTAQALWWTPAAAVEAGVSQRGGQVETQAGVSGAVAWLGRSVFTGRRIDDSFAVVDVAGLPGVRVLHDQQPVARTDASGRALVPHLRGHELNRLSVDAADLPMDTQVEALELAVQPPARSGVNIAMPLVRLRSAQFRLLRDDGTPPPPGSELQVEGQPARFPVGFEGRAYAAGLASGSVMTVRWAGAACRAVLPPLAPSQEGREDLGTLRCVS